MNKAEMTKAEMRISVAEDVLKSLNKYGKVKIGMFIGTPANYSTKYSDLTEDCKMESHIKAEKIKPFCQVCALGAAFLSQVKLKLDDGFKFSTQSVYTDPDTVVANLGSFFSMSQMVLIESAFECQKGYTISAMSHIAQSKMLNSAAYRKAIKFGISYTDLAHDYMDAESLCYDDERSVERLKAIMKNIVDNAGTFKP